ncbi:MAG: Unknown protein [uncultured Thiotrichaceae bacterium]|uniref:Uncharacterized protein n=1 Tax=uncultured Thiotrichaceae bacterium TaxID=298394 RepID=A0A6S6T223_9GAMM|nr:MAG: Unknown protein [uncultured Thiotrichaceae bacterium]
MLFKLIAMLFIGLTIYGIYSLLNKLLSGSIPRWVLPASIALSMVLYHIYDEYTWADRTIDGIEAENTLYHVVGIKEDQAFWRPWTYIWPLKIEINIVLDSSITKAEDGSNEAVLIQYRHPGMSTTFLMKYSCTDAAYILKAENAAIPAAFTMNDSMKKELCNGSSKKLF